MSDLEELKKLKNFLDEQIAKLEKLVEPEQSKLEKAYLEWIEIIINSSKSAYVFDAYQAGFDKAVEIAEEAHYSESNPYIYLKLKKFRGDK